ncbi:uncharacterized protein LOC114881388 [Osmia bicornis bicornis]|uniref:uncharacterized protein LOC114881388 n=1 Tax=Osmia bicornis bicornis TaxID=1437191 RepID=UPI001EAF7AE0|nr:uncharacterized protein LOC114881388 [Osmia bicornis bicornis]
MGLLVDMPKQGYGNSNDGNTSRRFFKKPEISARITGVDIRLIRRFKVILEVISSGHKINVEKFGIYTMDTAKLYVQLYSWYPMTPTVHKVLIHGPLVIQDALVPIGQLSEEAMEARNKYVRNYRLNHARKFSREGCNMDVLKRLLVTSDPLISSLRKNIKKKSEPYTKEVTEMFLPISEAEEEEEEEDTDEETDEESFIDS